MFYTCCVVFSLIGVCCCSDDDECDPPTYRESCDALGSAHTTSPNNELVQGESRNATCDMDVSCDSDIDNRMEHVGSDTSVEEDRAQYYDDPSNVLVGRKQQNITGGQQGKTHLSEARLGSQGKTDDMEVSQESDNHDNKDTEEYNSFLYWRTPLPDVDIAIAAPVVPQHTAKSAPALHDAHERTAAKSQSSVTVGDIASELSENLAGVDIGMSGGDVAQSKDTDDTIVVHTASLITTEEEPTEMVAHFGTTHVLGEHVGESSMKVIDGVVQGECGVCLSLNIYRDKLCARPWLLWSKLSGICMATY